MVLLLQLKEHAISLFMKILKIISITSYLMICGCDQVGLPIFVSILYFMMAAANTKYFYLDSFYGALFTLALLGTVFTILFSNKYVNRFLVAFCYATLFVSIIYLTGVNNAKNWNRISSWFVVPTVIFIASSTIVILKSFKERIK